MIVGFTGTQHGMTPVQQAMLAGEIHGLNPTELHHGDCIGADAQVHQLICHMYIDGKPADIVPHIHPPTDDSKRAWCQAYNAILYKARPYLDRNHDIVEACELLIVCPRTAKEQLRSGTWATYRYAKVRGCRVVIINPEGDVICE